ncbi:MAG: hypothetical protein KDM91_13175 [Verrucomicrobiae bacterium]|nr:hypothetical protein [Verrucomicrobiae bacterium]MCP5550986.1 hypothetical protein [Akkermansiaceae bacterium]
MSSPALFLFTAFAALLATIAGAHAKDESAKSYFKNPKSSGLALKSVGPIAFGPAGMLLVSDPRSASVFAIDTGDAGPIAKLGAKIENVEAAVSAALGGKEATIIDMAVNPASGKIYLSVSEKPGNQPHILALHADGSLVEPDLAGSAHVRMTLPVAENAQFRNVTDLAWGNFSVIVAGQSSEEFSNKIYQIPIPLEDGENAQFYAAETYHVSHKKWETKAPIQSFIPYEEDGKFYIVGAFACTPIAKFPISDLESGAKIKGTSVVELGSGNRPRDMFTYTKDGEEWLVTNTQRFGKNLFGPSKYWAARVKMDYLDADAPEATNENAPRRNTNAPNGPDAKGIEVVDALFGAVLVSQLDNAEVVVMRESSDDGPHSLELITLP